MKSIGYRDLKSVAILNEVNEKSLNALFNIAINKTYEANEYIVKQNEKAETAFIIVRGTAEVFILTDSGEKKIITLMGPGDIIGLGDKSTFYESWIRTANIMALEPMILYEFKVQKYLELLKDHPSLKLAFDQISLRMSNYSFIKKLFPFAAFDYRKMRSIVNLLNKRKIPKGTTIIREGDISDFCYFILKGQVEVSHIVDGKKHFLKLLDAGEIVGESALLLDIRRTATVDTATDCVLLEAKGEDLKEVIYKHSDLSIFYLDIVRKRLRPRRISTIEVYSEKSGDKNSGFTLKNPETATFYQLTNHGYFIWNLLDGEHTINSLNEKFLKHFNVPPDKFVTQLVYDLMSYKFIENPAENLESAAAAVPEHSFFDSILVFLKGLKRRFIK